MHLSQAQCILHSHYVLKTTDFQMFQSMLIVPSLWRQLSSHKKNFEKWCFWQEEEAKEVFKFCQTMLVPSNTTNIQLFSSQFFTRNKQHKMSALSKSNWKKNQYSHLYDRYTCHHKNSYYNRLANITTSFHVCFWHISHDTLLLLVS